MEYYIYEPVTAGCSTFYAHLGKTVEADEVPESATQWQPPETNEGFLMYWDGFGWVRGIDVRNAELSELQSRILKHVGEIFSSQVNSLKRPYSDGESDSWAIQLADAQNVLKGATDSVLLHALAEIRNVDVKELAQKIIDKSQAYYKQYAQVLGQYQKEVNQIQNAKSIDDLPKFDLWILTS
jgi:hypothetical protein